MRFPLRSKVDASDQSVDAGVFMIILLQAEYGILQRSLAVEAMLAEQVTLNH